MPLLQLSQRPTLLLPSSFVLAPSTQLLLRHLLLVQITASCQLLLHLRQAPPAAVPLCLLTREGLGFKV